MRVVLFMPQRNRATVVEVAQHPPHVLRVVEENLRPRPQPTVPVDPVELDRAEFDRPILALSNHSCLPGAFHHRDLTLRAAAQHLRRRQQLLLHRHRWELQAVDLLRSPQLLAELSTICEDDRALALNAHPEPTAVEAQGLVHHVLEPRHRGLEECERFAVVL